MASPRTASAASSVARSFLTKHANKPPLRRSQLLDPNQVSKLACVLGSNITHDLKPDQSPPNGTRGPLFFVLYSACTRNADAIGFCLQAIPPGWHLGQSIAGWPLPIGPELIDLTSYVNFDSLLHTQLPRERAGP